MPTLKKLDKNLENDSKEVIKAIKSGDKKDIKEELEDLQETLEDVQDKLQDEAKDMLSGVTKLKEKSKKIEVFKKKSAEIQVTKWENYFNTTLLNKALNVIELFENEKEKESFKSNLEKKKSEFKTMINDFKDIYEDLDKHSKILDTRSLELINLKNKIEIEQTEYNQKIEDLQESIDIDNNISKILKSSKVNNDYTKDLKDSITKQIKSNNEHRNFLRENNTKIEYIEEQLKKAIASRKQLLDDWNESKKAYYAFIDIFEEWLNKYITLLPKQKSQNLRPNLKRRTPEQKNHAK